MEPKTHWNAVWAVSISVAGLIMAEFLPASLLTPMAGELRITEGMAGQAITATSILALLSSLFISLATKGLDRRWVLLSFAFLQVISNLLVAFAPNFFILTLGRLILGIAIGGFWSMSASTAMRLVPENLVPKALSIIFGATSVATVVAAPMGSYLGSVLGWRNVFILSALLGLIALIAQFLTLPSMPSDRPAQWSTLIHILRRKKMGIGMLAVLFLFAGNSVFFSYMRPFLETITHVNNQTLSFFLLAYGISNLLGTTLAGYPIEKSLKATLILSPLLMGIASGTSVLFGNLISITLFLVSLSGFAFGAAVVGWSTWLTRTIPDEAESGGGILVASIQLAITLGAGLGGFLFDKTGGLGAFTSSCIILLAGSVTSFYTFRKKMA